MTINFRVNKITKPGQQEHELLDANLTIALLRFIAETLEYIFILIIIILILKYILITHCFYLKSFH